MLAYQSSLDQFASAAKRSRDNACDDCSIKRLRCGPSMQSGLLAAAGIAMHTTSPAILPNIRAAAISPPFGCASVPMSSCRPSVFATPLTSLVSPVNSLLERIPQSATSPTPAPPACFPSMQLCGQPIEQPNPICSVHSPAAEPDSQTVHNADSSQLSRCGFKRGASPVPLDIDFLHDSIHLSSQPSPCPPKRFKVMDVNDHVAMDTDAHGLPSPASTSSASATSSNTWHLNMPADTGCGTDSQPGPLCPASPGSEVSSGNFADVMSGGELVLYRPVEPYTRLKLAPELEQLISRQLPVSGVQVVACPGAQGAIISYKGPEVLSQDQIEAFWHANPMYVKPNVPSCTIEELKLDEGEHEQDGCAMEL